MEDEGGELLKMNALIRYHLNINPKELSEDEWAETWVGLKWCLDESKKQFEKINK